MQNARGVWIAIREHLQARDEVAKAPARLTLRERGQNSLSSRPTSNASKKGRAMDPVFEEPRDTDKLEKFGQIWADEVYISSFFRQIVISFKFVCSSVQDF